jgi:ubiquinone/menaquinone biosynthesis C-methylase UbiE
MNYFQELANKYDAWFKTAHGQYVYRYEYAAVMELARVRPGLRIIDIGCGTGIYTNELCDAGAKVVGVDISPEMLAIAAEKNKRHGKNVSFVAGDAASLPFADGSFDMAVSISAMEFFADPAKCLQEMYRVVKPGGRLIVATLNSRNPWALQRRIKARLKQTVFSHANFYSITDLRRLFKPHPLTAWRGCIFIPPFAPDNLIARPERVERWGQKYFPALGAFIVVRVDKI